MDLNKVFVLGRLTADPQLRSTPTGQQVTSFGVATNRVWNDKSGTKQQEVEFHNVVLWGRQAEIVAQFLTKGSMILVEGRLRTRTWQNQQGQTQRTTEIIGERIQLGPRPTGQSKDFSGPAKEGFVSPKNDLPEINIDEEEITAEDLPF
ncbi:MAG: single-stranded DNA-binding protein [Candidatus Paceibacterota bacterium]